MPGIKDDNDQSPTQSISTSCLKHKMGIENNNVSMQSKARHAKIQEASCLPAKGHEAILNNIQIESTEEISEVPSTKWALTERLLVCLLNASARHSARQRSRYS